MGDEVRGVLVGTGMVEWCDVAQQLEGMRAAWVDSAGWHVDGVPATAPATSWLWAWARGSWAAVRIEGERAVAGIVRPPTGEQDGDVTLCRMPVRGWDNRRGTAELPNGEWVMWVASTDPPLTFVGLDP